MSILCQKVYTINVNAVIACFKADAAFVAYLNGLGSNWDGTMTLQMNGDYDSVPDNVGDVFSLRKDREIVGQWNFRGTQFGNFYSANGPSSAGTAAGVYTATLNLIGAPNTVTMAPC